MTVARVLEKLATRGWRAAADGDRLILEPAGPDVDDLTEAQWQWLARHKHELLAVLLPAHPWTEPAYPSGPCATCGSRRWLLPAGATGWQCDTCHPAPDAPFNSYLLAPRSHTAPPVGQGSTTLPAHKDHAINAPQSPQWTASELERQRLVLQGQAVVVNQRKGKDEALRAWAEQQGLLVRIVRGTDWGNPYEMPKPERPGDRDTVCDKHQAWLATQPVLLARIPELRGKVLECWCYPERCHGDHLAELANATVGGPP